MNRATCVELLRPRRAQRMILSGSVAGADHRLVGRVITTPIPVITMPIPVITMPIPVITMRRSRRSRWSDPGDHVRAERAIGAPRLPVDVGRLGRHAPRVRLVVGWDVDGDAAARTSWRLLAARLAVPALVCMSGSRPGWADPRDSRLECFQTHAGPFARFIARGVPAFGAEPRRVAIGVDAESVRVLSGKTLFVRMRGTRWAPARDFDGVLHARPTVVTSATLAARVGESAWAPVDDFEAAATLEGLAAAVATGAPVAASDRVRETIGRCAAVLGQPASRIWARALAAMWGPDLARPLAQATRFDLHPSTFDGCPTRRASAWRRSRT